MAKKKLENMNPEKESKPHHIPDVDREYLKKIAALAKDLRVKSGHSYESFSLHAGINRNSYFRFERSAATGDNYTIALLLKVIRGLDIDAQHFFNQIK